jgi:peptidoglycan/LPS O-acetylase OafA/YrhL
LNDPGVRAFVRKRALRIFPALICAVGLTALVLGPIFTTQSLPAFLASANVASYIVSNVLLFPQYVLATVFTHNPVAAANGSLWTLPIEVRAYLLLAVFALVAKKERPVALSAVVVLMICNAALNFGESARLTTIFACGSALYLLRQRIVLRYDLALVLLAAWVASFETAAARPIGMVALPYLVAWLAYCTPRGLRRLTAKGDASYGMYVYAFPVQQALVATFAGIGPWLLASVALPLLWLVGLMSWRLIEEPMLRRKRRANPLREVAPALTP